MSLKHIVKHLTTTFSTILIVATSALFFSCGNSSDTFNDGLSEAKNAIERSDMSNAQKICDGLYGMKEQASAKQLATLSLLFMEISNNGDSEKQTDNIAAATQCYIEAFSIDADSASAFYNSLENGADIDRFTTLHLIADGINDPYGNDSIPDHEMPENIDDLIGDDLISSDSATN